VKDRVDRQHYRDAMSHFGSAVHIVSTDGIAGRRGVTVTAVCSVSDNPATLLVCLNDRNPYNTCFEENGVFALNTLASGHMELSKVFSGDGGLTQDERFALGAWDVVETGAPVLADAMAVFDCEVTSSQLVETHRVLFGRVVGLRIGDGQSPLIYHKRGYHIL
jgi:cob(II)yrinic acid a,c-diamide reductase